MIVDVWAQITTERMAKRPWLEPLMRWTAGSGEHLLSSPERTLAAMDEGGVDIAFLSAWHGPEGDLISNEEVARQIDAAPTRFRGLASVDLHNPMAGVREIRRWVDGRPSLACVSCLGFGICHRTIGSITRSTPLVWMWACHFAHRSATLDHSNAQKRGGSFPISRTCCSTFPSLSLSQAMSAFHGSMSWSPYRKVSKFLR